jgi:hypothetical protein
LLVELTVQGDNIEVSNTTRCRAGAQRGGAASIQPRRAWWQIWVGLGLWVSVIAVAQVADAAKSAADARWAREEDRGWQKWLKASPEERRRWPQERVAWNAWEYEAQDIDDEALKAARKAAKKPSK